MSVFFLKLRFLFLLACMLSPGAKAQQTRFIYIQTENKQPFYVKLDKRILSSSASGYIIISKLIDSTYNLVIGFPENKGPDMQVPVNVQDTNAGFLLKHYSKDDWGMINLQSLQLQVMKQSPPPIKEVEVKQSEDEFARVLASVVNDPSIAEVPVIKAPGITGKTTEENAGKANVSPAVIMPVPADLPGKDTVINKPGISKLVQDNTSEGIAITYLDRANAATDTVKIFIPDTKTVALPETKATAAIPVTIKKEKSAVNKNTRFIDMELQNPNVKADRLKEDFVITEKKVVVNDSPGEKQETKSISVDTGKIMINSDCKKIATQNDFLKLRKQMVAQSDEKNMLLAGYKQFIRTCFTTEQVKNLGALFISEEERYKFFVAAYPFVSDTHNFAKLDDQLTDNYYKTRFKAMLNR